MNYGLTPTTNAAAGTASQPPRNPLPESNTNTATTRGASTLNPKAQAFIPRAHQQPKTPIDITGRKTTPLRQTPFTPMPYRRRQKTPPEATVRIRKAFTELKNKHFREAEKAFRQILQHQGQLSRYDYDDTSVGLARSLKEQTREKQMEACHVLESLRQNGSFTEFGASTILNLDLTLSLCEQALGRYRKAEVRLLALRYKKPDAGEDSQCNPSGCYNIDLALALLWQEMGKHNQAERLLLNMKNEMEVSLQLVQRELKDIEAKLEKRELEKRELEMQREQKNIKADLEMQRKLKEIQELKSIKRLLDGDKEPLRKNLDETDLVLARHREVMGKHELAENLLLSMSGKHPSINKDSLCKPYGHHTLDLTLARHWEVEGKNELAEKLLLNMSRKRPGAPRNKLCKPFGHHELDLTLALHWQVTGKYGLAEELLLNMSGKRPGAPRDKLCKPCGHHELDLTLARHWEVMGKHELAEELLLNMSGKQSDDNENSLCRPCGRHELDLALARLWEVMGKYKLAEKLLKRCCQLYRSAEFETALLGLSIGQERFMEVAVSYPESAGTLLTTSIHYFRLACEEIVKGGLKSGEDNLDKALESVEKALEKYPPTAGAFSQKGHCLRMMGKSEQEWCEWFRRAASLDPSRIFKEKSDPWRKVEKAALEKMRGVPKELE